MLDGSRLPIVEQDAAELALAGKYAPIVLADEVEPFTLLAAGYTIFDQEAESPSWVQGRRVEWLSTGYPAVRALEYALWWDLDIGHFYDLEHAWTFIGADGEIAAVEASWHGMYGLTEGEGGRPVVLKTHPVLLAQPGKHAMAATPGPFQEIRDWAEQEAGPDAGKNGVLENDLFRGKLHKTPENDAKATAYLKERAFTPTWRFTRRFAITRPMLLPWRALAEWIPERVEWLLAQA